MLQRETHQLIWWQLGSHSSDNIPDSELKKKHIAISYHYVREAIVARIINTIWLRSHANFSDIYTKALGSNIFEGHIHEMMAWISLVGEF